jgi:hypothetical protein
VRAALLSLSFALAMLVASVLVAPVIFFRSLIRGARSFHPRGTICRAEVIALDDVVGPRLAGDALVRLSGVSAPENAPDQTVCGMAIKFGTDQDLALATFEGFLHVAAGVKNTNVADYLANQFASATPWRTRGLGVVWLRAMPPATSATTGTRTERLDADIAAKRAVFVLEARTTAGANGPLRSRIAEIRLVERLAVDDPSFRISMFRTKRGIVPTGFRNGVRAIAYPVSQLGRRLRGC